MRRRLPKIIDEEQETGVAVCKACGAKTTTAKLADTKYCLECGSDMGWSLPGMAEVLNTLLA